MQRFAFLVLFFILLSCKNDIRLTEEKPVARVLDKTLTAADLTGIIPEGVSAEDSIQITKNFIEKWVQKQLLLNKAELNLTDDEKDVKKQIENYRSSLLIYKYEQSLLKQKLDTTISNEEMEAYYNQNTSNFLLNRDIVKSIYIKVPRSAPEIYKLRQWYRSDDPESIKSLEAYCFQHAETYDFFNESWVDFSGLLDKIPVQIGNPGNFLRYRQTIEASDSVYNYFVRIYDYALSGDPSPSELVKDDIEKIILNKRKMRLLNELETSIYNDAQNRGQFTLYK
jgi:Fe-S cluster biosynthesis and repair protein YggX